MLANKYNTYGSSETDRAPDHVVPVAHSSPSPVSAPVVAPEQIDSRNSWEENDSDDEPYPMDAYDYGRDDDDDESESESESKQDNNGNKQQLDEQYPSSSRDSIKHNGTKTFDQPSDDEDHAKAAPNPNLFRASAVNSRASINSGRSYSSHTKHHSFGYGDDRPEASESESDSSSESESEQEDAIVNASSSPPPPPIPTASRPVSITASPRVPSASVSPVTSKSAAKEEQQQEAHEAIKILPVNEGISASSPPASPTLSKLTDSIPSTAAPANPQTLTSPTSTSSLAPSDQTHRPSGSESDTSTSSVDLRSPSSVKGHLKANNQRPGMLPRSLSNTSSRGFQDSRALSYSDLSDAELNEVSLDEPATQEPIRRSATIATPRVPVTSSNAGFPSSFFGGRPHPKSHQFHQQQSSAALSSPQAAAPPVPLPSSVTSPDNRPGSARQASISSIASSISGALMGRGFGGNTTNGNTAALPPPPATSRTPSRMSQRGSNAGMVINTGNNGLDLRSTSNISPERASTYSTMTTDSNMDLLLARLEAQNSVLEQDPKGRATSETSSEIDRAFGHAKEESASEDVDWDYWGSLMHDYNGVVKKNPKQLTVMIQKGVPQAIRGLTWQLLAHSKDAQLEATYADLLKETSSHEKQIQRDMSRTFPNHEHFQAEGLGQESLFNVVKAYSLYDAEVGYCQGLSFVVGPLLLNMPDEEAFCVLVKMMTSYDMRGHFTPDMNTLQLRLYQFEQLMEETVPLVHKHFLNQGIRSTMYASQWFMTLFAYKFPLDLVFRIYDTLLVEGVESLLRFAIALLKASHDQILNHEFETLIEFLKNGLFEPYMNDPSMFVKDAYNVKVTPKKLTQYTQKYQTMIQRQQAELAAEESLRESNRQLSLHVRRLEGSLHTLNKEHVDLAKELISRKVEMAQLQDQNDVLLQKVSDLTRMVDAQGKEVEDRYKDEIQAVMEKNVELVRKNEQADEQCGFLESLLIDTKMKYAESENEREGLARKLGDLKKALGVA
ncbi:GTPase-activating protein [Mortierella hygrophila]|uniref:GTPase-activating protein n=1 Tax=Mortierella hygrophila TaxID=979708 RepID=A0A9P6FBW6_9FUNG|nr:GTPase-activating protein [Mortierella hygrophila]